MIGQFRLRHTFLLTLGALEPVREGGGREWGCVIDYESNSDRCLDLLYTSTPNSRSIVRMKLRRCGLHMHTN